MTKLEAFLALRKVFPTNWWITISEEVIHYLDRETVTNIRIQISTNEKSLCGHSTLATTYSDAVRQITLEHKRACN